MPASIGFTQKSGCNAPTRQTSGFESAEGLEAASWVSRSNAGPGQLPDVMRETNRVRSDPRPQEEYKCSSTTSYVPHTLSKAELGSSAFLVQFHRVCRQRHSLETTLPCADPYTSLMRAIKRVHTSHISLRSGCRFILHLSRSSLASRDYRSSRWKSEVIRIPMGSGEAVVEVLRAAMMSWRCN